MSTSTLVQDRAGMCRSEDRDHYQCVRGINSIPWLPLTLTMSASSLNDMSSTDDVDRYTISDASSDSAESDYQVCKSYVSEGTAEDVEDGEPEILRWNFEESKWEPIQAWYVIDIRDMV